MSHYIGPDFLLENRYSKELYHDYAHSMPIIDYHNHLSPSQIANDVIFQNLTQAWIHGDHYKWRALRTLGIDEKFITGSASDEEKFLKWAYAVPFTMRNPLYHWTHLELQRYFQITDVLRPDNALAIYDEVGQKLQSPEYSYRSLLTHMNVAYLCTTEDPTDTLEDHGKIATANFKTKVSTAFRPDNAIHIDSTQFNSYLQQLSKVTGADISTYDQLCDALANRITYFHERGCRISDHGLPHLYSESFTESEIKSIFKKKIEGRTITQKEVRQYKCALLLFLSKKYHEYDWVQQFHLGALRNNNTRMYETLGPNTGWDSIGDWLQAERLSKFLNRLDSENALCKTIIYNLNPRDNEVMASMVGNFNDGSIKGKIQFGSGWWFLDQKEGMTNQINALSNIGLLSCFVGMLTDSRSVLSFPRHEYFRRILCNIFGKEIENGELPTDIKWIGKLIQDVCYHNARSYFNLEL